MGYPVGKGAMKKNINLNLRRVKARVRAIIRGETWKTW